MENKNVGYLIVGISVVIGFIIYIFNFTSKKIAESSCDMGPTCGMYDTISIQTWISIAIAGIVLIIGLFLIFSKQQVKVITKRVKDEKKKISLEGLDTKEKEAVKIIQQEGAIFQATLMEKLEIGKVGLTRMLDKLEAKQIIERKRRGMNNIVVLKKD
jgi:uncharacterized membrane protein